MSQKWSTKGAIAPLFDRLSDFEPLMKEETPPFVTYGEEDLKKSIQQECMRILNTRCKLTEADYAALEPQAAQFRFPQFFGLPDGTYANPKNTTDAYKIERMMGKAIEIFEPRLQNVHVSIQPYNDATQSLSLSVEGDLVVGDVNTPITFPIALQSFQEQGELEKAAYDTRPQIEFKKEY